MAETLSIYDIGDMKELIAFCKNKWGDGDDGEKCGQETKIRLVKTEVDAYLTDHAPSADALRLSGMVNPPRERLCHEFVERAGRVGSQ